MPQYPTDRVSLHALQQMLAQNADEAFLSTLKIDHPSFDQPFHFIDDTLDLTDSYGTHYIAYPFAMELPDDRDDQVPTVSVTIANVDRRLIPALRSMGPPPAIVTMGLVMRSEPDNAVIVPLDFQMQEINYDALKITATLTYEFKLSAKFPRDAINPATCPAVF